MSGATIIRLEPSTSEMAPRRRFEAATFEEAFGEFSEARGKGRARRKKRRLERIQNRREVRTERRKLKGDRQEERIERRRKRKSGRQQIRNEQAEARQSRKQRRGESRNERRMTREHGKQERENYVQEQELFRQGREPEEIDDTQDTGSDDEGQNVEPIGKPTSGSSDSSQDTGGSYSDDSSQDTGGSYSDDSSQDTGGSYSDEGYSDEGYSDEGYSDEGYSDEGYGEDAGNYSDEEEMGDYSSEDEGYTDGFDGVTLSDDNFSEMDDNSSSNKVAVPAGLVDLCNKIEWNKELISRLEEKRRTGVRNPSEISKQIIERKKRLADLQSDLDMYLGFVADFSGADGRTMVSSNRVKRPNKGQMRKRQIQVANARMKAMKMKTYGMGKQNAMSKNRDGGDVTPVDVELQPEIQKQRIVVPPSSPGFNSEPSYTNDFETRETDIQLGADGYDLPVNQPYSPFSHLDGDTFNYVDGDQKMTTTKINWTAVLVGVGVGALAIWAVRKYKLLGK
jgi:hypothetical protein